MLATTAAKVQSTGEAMPAPVLVQSAFVIGGAYQGTGVSYRLQPWNITRNSDLMLGGGCQHFLLSEPDGFGLGFEAGTAGRSSEGELSAEFYGGIVGRYDGFVLGDMLRVSPAHAVGLSSVTGKAASEKI
ncbi:MAG: hypothetical protein KKH72_11125 [Alphaproteobacteria bacterium]|nr:hypothetical protein [Alphaproteobacteria bacterium]